MGTETCFIAKLHWLFRVNRVKLNNPLMGTETTNRGLTCSGNHHNHVKLNNPLMGTETLILM